MVAKKKQPTLSLDVKVITYSVVTNWLRNDLGAASVKELSVHAAAKHGWDVSTEKDLNVVRAHISSLIQAGKIVGEIERDGTKYVHITAAEREERQKRQEQHAELLVRVRATLTALNPGYVTITDDGHVVLSFEQFLSLCE